MASSVVCHCFASIGIANDYGRTARGSFVDAIETIGQRVDEAEHITPERLMRALKEAFDILQREFVAAIAIANAV